MDDPAATDAPAPLVRKLTGPWSDADASDENQVELLAIWDDVSGTARVPRVVGTLAGARSAGALDRRGTFVAVCDGQELVAAACVAAREDLRAILVAAEDTGAERVARARAMGADVRVDTASHGAEPLPTIARRIATDEGAPLLRWSEDTAASTAAAQALRGVAGAGRTLYVPASETDLIRALSSSAESSVVAVACEASGPVWTHFPASRAPDEGAAVIRVQDAEVVDVARRLATGTGQLITAAGAAALAAARRRTADDGPCAVVLPERGEHELTTLHDPEWLRRHGLLRRTGSLTAAQLFEQQHGDLPELVSLSPASPLGEAIRIMQELEVSQIPIVDDGEVVGTLRDDQIIDLLLHAPEQQHEPVSQVMDDPLPRLPGDASLDDVQAAILRGAPAVLIHLSDERLGILTKYDLIHGLSLS